jgi:CO/xanthine dehydrogenase FAD-binding subunit
MDFHRPDSLAAATHLLAASPMRLLAGGTDVFPSLRDKPLSGPVLDLSGIAELRSIRETANHFVLGATTTWSDVINANLPTAFNALKLAAREVGSIQIQNQGTLAGNICNASPAADGVPPLLALDAEIAIASSSATRVVPLSQVIIGNRKTTLLPNELLTEIRIPKKSAKGTSTFQKLGARRYLVISIAMVAVRLAQNEGRISDCAIAVGACSEVAQRLRQLEHVLIGKDLHEIVQNTLTIETTSLDALAPIDDIRAPANYRLEAVRELIARAVQTTAKVLA